MAPLLSFVTSSGSKKKETRYVCLCEAKASHSHRKWTEVSSSVPRLKFATSSGSSVRAPPPYSPHQGLYGKRCSVSRANSLLIRLHFSVPPKKEPAHEMRGKPTVTVHGAPRGRIAYIQRGEAWFPKGIVCDTAITTPVPCSL